MDLDGLVGQGVPDGLALPDCGGGPVDEILDAGGAVGVEVAAHQFRQRLLLGWGVPVR